MSITRTSHIADTVLMQDVSFTQSINTSAGATVEGGVLNQAQNAGNVTSCADAMEIIAQESHMASLWTY